MDGKLSPVFTYMYWETAEGTNGQKYRGNRSEKMEHRDRPERAKWTHSETIRSCVETREANAKTEKGEEEKAKRGE